MTYESSRKRSGWNFFLKEQCPILKVDFPDAEIKELSQRASISWKKLSDNERRIYEEKSIVDKQERDRKRKAKEEGREDDDVDPTLIPIRQIQKKREEEARKREDISQTPFFKFLAEKQQEELSSNETGTILGDSGGIEELLDEWFVMSAIERQKYEQTAVAEEEQPKRRCRKRKEVNMNEYDEEEIEITESYENPDFFDINFDDPENDQMGIGFKNEKDAKTKQKRSLKKRKFKKSGDNDEFTLANKQIKK